MEPKKDRTVFYVLIGLITLLVLIFIFQNTASIIIKFLGINIKGPAFLVYLILYAAGFFSGWLWRLLRKPKKDKAAKEE